MKVKLPTLSGNTGESCRISAVQLAVKSNLFVKLHVNNSVQSIPVKNLIEVSENEECFVEKASFSTLRHCALSTLFKFSNSHVPAYAKSFETRIVYQHGKNELLIKCDDDLLKALDFAATESLMDDNDGFILDLWCRSIDMCPKNIKQSPLQIAMTSEMLIKLHVNDTGGMTTIIPVKNMIKYVPSRQESGQMVCAARLRQTALSSFFKMASKKTLNNYGARIVYRTKGEDIPVNTDTDFTRVVEKAALDYLPVLHLYCRTIDITPRKRNIKALGEGVGRMRLGHIQREQPRTHRGQFTSPEEMKKLHENASAAADNIVHTMKSWMARVRDFVENHQQRAKSADEFIVVQGTKEKDLKEDPFAWASRFVQFLLVPEVAMNGTGVSKEGNDVFFDLVQNIVSIIEESSARASDLIENAIAMHTQVQDSMKVNSTDDKSSNSSSHASPTPSLSDMSVECSSEEGPVSIGNEAEEWKAFFDDESFQDAVLIEGDVDVTSDISSFEDVKEMEDDDDSWVFEDE